MAQENDSVRAKIRLDKEKVDKERDTLAATLKTFQESQAAEMETFEQSVLAKQQSKERKLRIELENTRKAKNEMEQR